MKTIRLGLTALLFAALAAFTSVKAEEVTLPYTAAYQDGVFSAIVEGPRIALDQSPFRQSFRVMGQINSSLANVFRVANVPYAVAYFEGRASAFYALADLAGEP